jgi:stage II sporulation protein D
VKLTANDGGNVIEISDDEYIAGVLEGESSVFHSEEAMKAMAVAIRSYAAFSRSRHKAEGYDFCSTTHCQRFNRHGVNAKLLAVVNATKREMLWYHGNPAFAAYSRNCGGTTEQSTMLWPDIAAPYLPMHDDPYCKRNGSGQWTWQADPKQIAVALNEARLECPNRLTGIAILTRTTSNRPRTLKLEGPNGSQIISESSFRFAMGRALGWNLLKSDRYEIQVSPNSIVFMGTGQGHGIGLCQDGADEMGREGANYHAILAFYYPGTSIAQKGVGLPWQRLSGNQLTLYTTQPQRDGKLLALAEQLKRQSEERLQLESEQAIEIYVYPDLETYRNGTGEPGWVAAHSSQSRIDLQPVPVLESRGVLTQTLHHEIMHQIVEAAATPGLPLWFREGLVSWMTAKHRPAQEDLSSVNENGMRQQKDAIEARRNYNAAIGRVNVLISRYGEGTVVSWLRRGLPIEVTKASASSANTKSK